MNEADNLCRWDGHSPGHYEVWYVTFNHQQSDTGFWIRYTLEAPLHEPPYAQLWFAYFDARNPDNHFGINRRFPIEALRTESAPFSVSIAPEGDPGREPNQLTHTGIRGHLAGDGHEATWDLSWTPQGHSHQHLPRTMYRRGGMGETTVLSPNLDVALSGTVTVDGRRLVLEREPGGQTHLWGRKHANAWAWGHCNALRDRVGNRRVGACLEALSLDLVRAGIALPRLTLFSLYLDGRVHRFCDFRHLMQTRSDHGPGFFTMRGSGLKHRVEARFECRPEDMIATPYADPDGEPSWCANTEIADLEIIISERTGPLSWREHEVLTATSCGHFEIGRRAMPGTAMRAHVTVD
ncbi:MAG: hypothetical protein Tsb0020_37640 [Haliangiales bacterium]